MQKEVLASFSGVFENIIAQLASDDTDEVHQALLLLDDVVATQDEAVYAPIVNTYSHQLSQGAQRCAPNGVCMAS